MRVVTFSQKDFNRSCRELASKVAGLPVAPDCIIGIRTGGWIVAEEMSGMFPNARLVPVSLQRPSTAAKGGWVRPVVRMLPRVIQDWLRIVESRFLSMLGNGKIPSECADLPEEVTAGLKGFVDATVLVVDDAIDSGRTMWKVVEAIRRLLPSARIVTAVITVTTRQPLIMPDVTLYNDHTLIRFPWAMDAK